MHVTTSDMSLALLLGPQLRAFAAAGYEVVGASAPGPYADRLESWGIRHIALEHATRSMSLSSDARALRELYRLFRALRPDLVHTHNPKPGVYGRLAARAARVSAVVNTVHGLYALPEDGLAKRSVVYGLERLAATCSDAELVQNPEDVDTLLRLRVPRRKITLLGNGIDLARFDPAAVDPTAVAALRSELLGDGRVLCGYVGRLVWEKGLAELVDAATALRRRDPGIRVVAVGPTDPAKSDGLTEADLAEVGDRSGVRFLGPRDDVETVYAALDLFVLPSHREGFPRAAMEATAMGTPVVATDVRGCRQVVDDGVTGRLVPLGDAAALADTLADLAADDGLRRRMAAECRPRALVEFDQERVIALTLATYERLLSGHGSR